MAEPVELSPGIRRLTAPNPSPMTAQGTNTYLLGARSVAVIDPGPIHAGHLRSILDAVRGARVTAILVTHAHRDHAPLARALAAASGAPVLGFGPPAKGRSAVMAALAARGLAGGGEGVDHGFRPDRELADGDRVGDAEPVWQRVPEGRAQQPRTPAETGHADPGAVAARPGAVVGAAARSRPGGGEWALDVLWTPGHFPGHLCFALGDVVFTGDHVMGWASSLISPPEGDLADYMASCERLLARADRRFFPGHGDPVAEPAARLRWLLAHRREREAQILGALAEGPASIPALARRLYHDASPGLLPAAERNVFAHLVDLVTRGRVQAAPRLAPDASYATA